MGVPVEVREEDFRTWDHQAEGSLRWIHMGLEETSVSMADQALARTSSLDSGEWVRTVGVGVDTRVVEAGEMEGMEVVDTEVPGGMTIAIAITMEEVTTEGEATTEVGGVVIVNVGEAVEAVVGDIKRFLWLKRLSIALTHAASRAQTNAQRLAQANPKRNSHFY